MTMRGLTTFAAYLTLPDGNWERVGNAGTPRAAAELLRPSLIEHGVPAAEVRSHIIQLALVRSGYPFDEFAGIELTAPDGTRMKVLPEPQADMRVRTVNYRYTALDAAGHTLPDLFVGRLRPVVGERPTLEEARAAARYTMISDSRATSVVIAELVQDAPGQKFAINGTVERIVRTADMRPEVLARNTVPGTTVSIVITVVRGADHGNPDRFEVKAVGAVGSVQRCQSEPQARQIANRMWREQVELRDRQMSPA